MQEDHRPKSVPASNAARHPLATTKPQSVYAYFHHCVFFKKQILCPEDRRRLIDLGFGIRPRDKRKADDGRMIRPRGHKMWIDVPSREAVEALCDFNDITPYWIELAVDIIYGQEEKAEWVLRDMEHSLSQPRQSGEANNYDNKDTLYTRRRPKKRSFNLVTVYADLPSKITGEFACVHAERRCVGMRTLKIVEIDSAHKMLNFDLRAHWRKYLPRLFLHFDAARYGLIHDNVTKGVKRRDFEIRTIGTTLTYNRDASRGGFLYHNQSLHEYEDENANRLRRSLQCFVQKVGRDKRFLIPIPVDNILDRMTVRWGRDTPSLSIEDHERNKSSRLSERPLPKTNPTSATKPNTGPIRHRTPSTSQPIRTRKEIEAHPHPTRRRTATRNRTDIPHPRTTL